MTTYNTVKIENVNIFYREAGRKDAPVILLLHGFPSSSHMFRNLIPALEGDFHLLAPDYPGFGNSDCPPADGFSYTFDHLAEVIDKFLDALNINRFSLFMHDYGGPIGFRIAVKRPERIDTLMIQNANAYEEGLTRLFDYLRPLWESRSSTNDTRLLKTLGREGIMWQYTHGASGKTKLSPDAWNMDLFFLERPGNRMIQLELQADYGTNIKRYAEWHEYFRKHQPPTLVVWGRNDPIFSPQGAEMYRRDLKDVEVHMLDTGHFALEEDCEIIASLIKRFFIANKLKKAA